MNYHLANQEFPLNGQVALVTGAARRTGRFMALGLAKVGADVIIHYQNSGEDAERLMGEIQQLGRQAWCFKADLTDRDAIAAMTEEIVAKVGRLNILINNVGNYPQQSLSNTDIGDIQLLFNSNFFAAIELVQKLTSLLAVNTESHIINIGTAGVEHHLVNKNAPVYQITKNALFDATRIFAAELGSLGVRVNMLSPGQLFNSVDLPANVDKVIALQRTAEEDDIMAALMYLLRENSYSTGINVDVSGGYRQHF